MVNVVVAGATGKLGTMVCDLIVASDDLKLVGAIVSAEGGNAGKVLYPGVKAVAPSELDAIMEGVDVYVDLTTPDAASRIIDRIPGYGAAVVLGTTAVDTATLERMKTQISKNSTSGLIASNFSLGVNAFYKVCELMARMLSDYDIELIETHHNKKKDAPSGTAIELLERLQNATGIEEVVRGRDGVTGPRNREIGVHAVRAGDIVGDHTVIFAGNMERIELKHSALSREVFAIGCVRAIRWIAGRSDGIIQSMEEVLEV